MKSMQKIEASQYVRCSNRVVDPVPEELMQIARENTRLVEEAMASKRSLDSDQPRHGEESNRCTRLES